MSMYVTGDTHGYLDIKKIEVFSSNLKENDYLFIAGDFGLPFTTKEVNRYKKKLGDYSYWIRWMAELPCKILFVDGNHDNHDWWALQKVTEMYGGKVQIHPHAANVIHLMRGQVYTIEGIKFFIMGGADSIDKAWRIEGVSWWRQEMPSKEEMDLAIENLEKHNFTVDYIITHTCGSSLLCKFYSHHHKTDSLTNFFDYLEIDLKLNFKHWYFGHHHRDIKIDSKHTCVYQNILTIE